MNVNIVVVVIAVLVALVIGGGVGIAVGYNRRKAVAERERVPLIDLHQMTRVFFETLGYEDSKWALVHYPANTFPGQVKALADNTHFNPYGAYEVAKMVVMGMKQLKLPLTEELRTDFTDFDPRHPDDWRTFMWYPARNADLVKPDGN